MQCRLEDNALFKKLLEFSLQFFLLRITVYAMQSAVQDLLQAVTDLVNLPIPGRCYFPRMFVLRDLSIALSACIYQSLCDSDSFVGRHGQHNG